MLILIMQQVYCKEKNLAIEVDGKYHNHQKDYDKRREDFLCSAKMQVFRFNNDEVLKKTEMVLKALEEIVI